MSNDNSGGNMPPQPPPSEFNGDIYLDSADHGCALEINSQDTRNHTGSKPFEFTFFDENGEQQSIRGRGKLTDMRNSSKQGEIRFLAAAPIVVSAQVFTKGANAGRGQVNVAIGKIGTPEYKRFNYVDLSSTY
jgi:hypothetical protein